MKRPGSPGDARAGQGTLVTPDQLRSAFIGPVEPVRISFGYGVGLFIVALAMVVLPLVYLAIAGCVAYGTYYHATEHASMLTSGRGVVFRSFGYVGPIVVGCLVVVFMLKPLVAKPRRLSHPYSLEPAQAPVLFAFVHHVAESVGAPKPRLIEVTAEPNAAAAFRRGFLSLFTNDLVLTIGTPLIACLDTRQLAGVIAHELGHFSQRAGMRLGYVIRGINRWFGRVVYQRDAWDEQLKRASDEARLLWTQLLVLGTRLGIWLVRRLLWVLMMIGGLLSRFMDRRMEFDADQYEIRLAGSRAFESTLLRMTELSAAFSDVVHQLDDAHAEGRLCDDMPLLIASTADRMPPHVRAQVHQHIAQEKARLLDTHPPTRERIKRARRQNSPGRVTLKVPASCLLRSYAAISKWTTLAFYQQVFGAKIKVEELVPAQDLIERQKIIDEANKAAWRYSQGTLDALHAVFLDGRPLEELPEQGAAIRRLVDARRRVETTAPRARGAVQRLNKALDRLIAARQARHALEAGCAISATEFDLPRATKDAAKAAEAEMNREMQRENGELRTFDTALRERLTLAFGLLRTPTFAARIKHAPKLLRHLDGLLPVLSSFREIHPAVIAVYQQGSELESVLHNLQQFGREDAFQSYVHRTSGSLASKLGRLHGILRAQPYPFEHRKAHLSIAEYAIGLIPKSDNPAALYSTADQAFERLMDLLWQVFGRLALIAERVERSAGLPPMPPVEQPTPDG